MNKIFGKFYICSIIAIAMAAFATSTYAAVTARPTVANNAAAARAQNRTGARVPTTAQQPVATTPESAPEPEPEPVATPAPEPKVEEPIIVDNKTSVFEGIMAEIGAAGTDTSGNDLADAIRRQRALLDAPANSATSGGTINIGTAAACDAGLRKCMADKCGPDFAKCANDSTTIWGQKIDLCRAQTKCTAHEYSLIAPEILADRDMNVRMGHYNSVINCGNRYNDCIFTQCGKTLNKCLSKKDGDSAISKCASIANECKSMDNGLAARAMGVFGDLRKIATARVQQNETRLYELRNLMRDQCNRFGAMFDERTLDCVYTVNFFAGEDNTLMASKKLYSGDTFQCNPNWFGVDITTYIENAQRLTRSQRSASSAALGAGVGTAAGLLSSGAIGRAIDTKNAEKAVKEACEQKGGKWDGAKCTDTNGKEVEINKDVVQDEKKESNKTDAPQPETPHINESLHSEQEVGTETDKPEPQDIENTLATDPGLNKIAQASQGGLSYSDAQSQQNDKKVVSTWYNSLSGKHKDKIAYKYSYWGAEFDDDTSITGISVCSTKKDVKSEKTLLATDAFGKQLSKEWTNEQTTSAMGGYCYCRIIKPHYSDWRYTTTRRDSEDCADNCANWCAYTFNEYPSVRQTLFKTLSKTDKFPR